MKKLNLLFILLSIIGYSYSQKLHTTTELLKLIMDSKLSYEIKLLDKTIPSKDYSEKLNYNGCYRVESDSKITTNAYSINEKAKPLFDKAEKFFNSNPDSAMVYYKLALQADSSMFYVITYIGQIYERKKDFDNAILWYKKAIGKNYIDYMAHWFLADAYMTKNDINSALDEIVIARILNRNNKGITKSMSQILINAKRNNADWYFTPQIEFIKKSDKQISIAMNEKWTGYATAKALWTYEPGYPESMGVPKGKYSTLEDKECMVSLLVAEENAKTDIKNDPQLSILKNAAENKFLEEYILYEIVLPDNPFVAYQLPVETILSIKDYILKYRNTTVL
jgi:tetratricopeptide (TPR) repeat protein